jgi:hypothetical protein
LSTRDIFKKAFENTNSIGPVVLDYIGPSINDLIDTKIKSKQNKNIFKSKVLLTPYNKKMSQNILSQMQTPSFPSQNT